jgi:hypothetical protein
LNRAATAPARSGRVSPTTNLAKFFPDATPVRIPVRLTRMGAPGEPLSETTLLEFGTPREALFASTLPLEFGDMLRLQNSDGTLDTEACVVALQYNGDRTAVAARFTGNLTNWIVKS